MLFGVVGFRHRVSWLYLSILYDFLLFLNTGAYLSAFYVVDSGHIYHNFLAIFILFFIKLKIHKVDSLFSAKIGVFRQPRRNVQLMTEVKCGIHHSASGVCSLNNAKMRGILRYETTHFNTRKMHKSRICCDSFILMTGAIFNEANGFFWPLPLVPAA